jgi:hypothetical protein
MIRCRHLSLISAILVVCAASAVAGPGSRKDIGASNNGPGVDFTACTSLTHTSNCANFTTAPFETVNGVPVLKFAINPGDPTLTTIFDVFQLPGTITPGSQVALTFNTSTGSFGAFACNNSEDASAAFALDSNGNPLSGPCTAGSTDSLASFLSETDSGNTATFKFLAGAGFPSSWTFYTDDGNLASISLSTGGGGTVPEPGSLPLLAIGLVALGILVVIKTRA